MRLAEPDADGDGVGKTLALGDDVAAAELDAEGDCEAETLLPADVDAEGDRAEAEGDREADEVTDRDGEADGDALADCDGDADAAAETELLAAGLGVTELLGTATAAYAGAMQHASMSALHSVGDASG